MGKGEGVVLEADVGYKDGKSVFSPHGADQSHVEEDPQVGFSLLSMTRSVRWIWMLIVKPPSGGGVQVA